MAGETKNGTLMFEKQVEIGISVFSIEKSANVNKCNAFLVLSSA